MLEVSFTSEPYKLSGTLFSSKKEGGRPALLCLHGWTSIQDRYFSLGEAAAQRGYVCLTMDMPGHGKSEGNLKTLSRKEFLDGVVAGYDYLANLPNVNSSRIFVTGSSFGGYMAALLSAERPCAGLVLRAPADYPDEGFGESQHAKANTFYENENAIGMKWKEKVHEHSETASLRAVHAFGGPIMIIESGNDELVPQSVLQGYAQAVGNQSNLTYTVMEGAPHSLSSDPNRKEEYANLVLAFMDSNP